MKNEFNSQSGRRRHPVIDRADLVVPARHGPKPYKHALPPPAPPESQWRFVEVLANTPYHQPLRWKKRKPRPGEVSLAAGACLAAGFPDPERLLETAYADFNFFMAIAGLKRNGSYPIRIEHAATSVREEFLVRVAAHQTVIEAADTEGVRRAMIWIEDEMQRRSGPFLPFGVTARRPWVRTRISRCFFGPINRPPKLREELALDQDFYPGEYLNRLAHEGVNGLWLTINWFRDLPSKIIPEYGINSAHRLERLRRTARKCARYGIRVYVFCIEPAGFSRSDPELKAAARAHPELLGQSRAFCISTEKGKDYVEEATRTLFSAVPELGGLIVISVGERQTHCCSFNYAAPGCPRCRHRDPADVLGDTLAAMRRGMDAVKPEAELISWPYGQFVLWNPARSAAAAGRVPAGVCLQHNFETGGWNEQLGKRRPMWDYWQSVVGPAKMFRDCAGRARAKGTRNFAKLQVACGHEVTTTQYVPVPGIIFQKFRQMRKLGVTGAMLSWYPGAYPCLMTRVAGELSFYPVARDEKTFLTGFARRDWGQFAPQVVKAWKRCESGYKNYPTAHIFQYFGPMHDGVAWPLYLVPRRAPLSPFWQLDYPPSGDYIAECVTNGFSFAEILTLCRRMAAKWEQGARIMKRLLPRFRCQPDRLRDIRVTIALALQFRSGCSILDFYALRERLAEESAPVMRLALLRRMKAIVRRELALSREMLKLAAAEPLLGFNAEAEGYKYWPGLLRWRMGQLRGLLCREFPGVERAARKRAPLFPEYTGSGPAGEVYVAARVSRAPAMDGRVTGPAWEGLAAAECRHGLRHTFNAERWKKCYYDAWDHFPAKDAEVLGRIARWKACHEGRSLYLGVSCPDAGWLSPGIKPESLRGSVQVIIEPCRTLPRMIFNVSQEGAQCQKDDNYIQRPRSDNPWRTACRSDGRGWSFVLRIPLRWLRPGDWRSLPPMRINVRRKLMVPREDNSELIVSWARQKPVKGRLVWKDLNPATDFGWLKLG